MINEETTEKKDEITIINDLERKRISYTDAHWDFQKHKDQDHATIVYQLVRENLDRAREIQLRFNPKRGETCEPGSEKELEELVRCVEEHFDTLFRADRGPGVLQLVMDLKKGETWEDIDRMIDNTGFGWYRRDSEHRSINLIATPRGLEILKRYDDLRAARKAGKEIASQTRETGSAANSVVAS
jgi:hypothetical protein